jgi:hypothetical protein
VRTSPAQVSAPNVFRRLGLIVLIAAISLSIYQLVMGPENYKPTWEDRTLLSREMEGLQAETVSAVLWGKIITVSRGSHILSSEASSRHKSPIVGFLVAHLATHGWRRLNTAPGDSQFTMCKSRFRADFYTKGQDGSVVTVSLATKKLAQEPDC